MSVVSTVGVLLRVHPFRETSLVLRFYTRDMGLLGVLAKGRRRLGGKGVGASLPFAEGVLLLSVRPGRELQTLRDFVPQRSRFRLGSHPLRLAGASILGELALHQGEGEANAPFFQALSEGLDALEAAPLDRLVPDLLARLWGLVGLLGYRPVLNRCVRCGRSPGSTETVRFDSEQGGICCGSCSCSVRGPRLGPLAREQLSALVEGMAPPGLLGGRSHLRLVGDFVAYHLAGGLPLRSLAVLRSLLAEDHG